MFKRFNDWLNRRKADERNYEGELAQAACLLVEKRGIPEGSSWETLVVGANNLETGFHISGLRVIVQVGIDAVMLGMAESQQNGETLQ